MKLTCLFLCVGTFVLPLGLSAANITWTNGNGGNWNTATNWSPNTVPGASDAAFITNNGSYTVTLDVDATVTSLTLGGASGTQTFSASSRTFTLNGASVIKGNGVMELFFSTVAGAGSLTNQGTMNPTACTINAAVVNQGLLVFRFPNVLGGSFENPAGATMRVLADGNISAASVTVASGFTNRGVIELTSTNSAADSRLDVSSGSLVNAGGQINVLAGAGGPRTMGLQLDNQGTVTINQPLALSKTAANHSNSGSITLSGGDLTVTQPPSTTPSFSFTTMGTIDIPGGRTFTVGDVGLAVPPTFNYAGGTVGGAGTLNLSSIVANFTPNFNNGTTTLLLLNTTLNGPGRVTNVNTLTVTACTISAVLVNQGLLVFRFPNVLSNSFENPAGATMRVLADGNLSAASVTVASGFTFTNRGVIELTSTNLAADARLDVSSGSLVNAGGQINVLAGAGGPRTMVLQLDNQGTVTINQPLSLSKTAANHSNSGSITLSGGDLTVTQPPSTTPSFSFTTTGTIDIPGGRTFTVGDVGLAVPPTFNYAGGTVGGAGTLNLSSIVANFTPNFNNGTTTLLLLNTTLNGPGRVTNVNTLTMTTCTISAVLVNQGLLVFRFNNVLSNSFENLAGATMRVVADGNISAASVTVASGFTNRGLIELTSTNLAADARLDVSSGSLVNAAGGQINVVAGVGGTRTMVLQLDNQATMTINQPLSLSKASAHHLNSGSITLSGADLTVSQSGATPTFTTTGTIDIPSGRTFTVAGGSFDNIAPGTLQGNGTVNVSTATFSNAGNVNPGASPGTMTFVGNFSQTAAGTLNIELGGTSPGTTFDLLHVTGAATLAGTLNATLVNGFFPSANAMFTFLTNASRSGTFATFNFPSNALGMTLNYTTTNATIQVINTAPVIPTIVSQTTNELTLFSLAVNATDADQPPQTLTYALTNSPALASINSSGVITWTPTEAQGPMVTNITVLVTDNGTPNLTASRTFQITVNEINVAPVLTLPASQAFNEQTPFSANATATDSDLPANSFTFQLVSGPTGLTVLPTGAIAWTPDESQGSNTFTVTIRVTDLNTNAVNAQQLSTTNSFLLTVNESNRPPVLTVPGTQTVTEQTLLTVTNTATDPDLPANVLTFDLISPPAGVSVNSSNGVLTWTPSEAQGPSTNTITVRVTDNNPQAVNTQQLSDTKSFTVIVTESNAPPVLTLPPNATIDELTLYTNMATANDPDIPTQPLTFSLVSGPADLTVSSGGGISWTPTEAQGPGVYPVTIRVTDSSLSVTGSYTLTVNELISAPTISDIPNQTIQQDTSTGPLPFTVGDAETPAGSLTLGGGSSNPGLVPIGNIVFGGSGSNRTVQVTPVGGQVGTATITVTVTDGSSATASDTFLLTVLTSLAVEWSTVDGGGNTSTNSALALGVSGTIGQPDAGRLTGATLAIEGGFWGVIAVVSTPGAPLLTITGTTTNTVMVSWPSPSTGFLLQQNTDLSSAIWTTPPESVHDDLTIKFIIVNPPTGNRFYRLFKP